jgi:hypothetical protein
MNFSYFSIQSELDNHSGNYYPRAVPDNGLVDVYENHYWKLGSLKEEIPNIVLKEYILDYARWTASLSRFLTVARGLITNQTVDPYKDMYLADETGFTYNLPYIIESGQSIRGGLANSWTSTDGNVFGGLQKMFPVLTKWGDAIGQMVSTGWGTEPLITYKQTSRRNITIKFPLFNTQDLDSANNNFSFVNLFYFQNLKTRTSWTTFLPPKVYSIDTPALGGLSIPLAYVKRFAFRSLGQLRQLTDYGSVNNRMIGGGLMDFFGQMGLAESTGRLIPEAYLVEITLEEMLPESANINVGTLGYQKVSVIGRRGSTPSLGMGPGQNVATSNRLSPSELNSVIQTDPIGPQLPVGYAGPGNSSEVQGPALPPGYAGPGGSGEIQGPPAPVPDFRVTDPSIRPSEQTPIQIPNLDDRGGDGIDFSKLGNPGTPGVIGGSGMNQPTTSTPPQTPENYRVLSSQQLSQPKKEDNVITPW